jgi:hypothetical protein
MRTKKEIDRTGWQAGGATWPDERYRDLSYAMDETEKLAKQVAQVK